LHYADDAFNMHWQTSPQRDAHCHTFLNDKMYNGYDSNQPWHGAVLPAIGLSEFVFTAPPLHLPGGAGSPINPQAIK
jgi:hypothetical protein